MRASAVASKWLTLIATCLGLGMLMIDTFVVNIALPAIGRDLEAALSTIEWTVSGYVLVVGILPVVMGRLGDIFGRRRVYLSGLLTFILASIACGAAQSIHELVAFRILQGVGAATMTPGTLSIITQAFPPEQRGLAIGIWGGVSSLGLIASPILGGLLVHGDSWRMVFFINVPVGAAALVMTTLFVPESRDEGAPRALDLLGLTLLSSALFFILFGFTRANDGGWTSPRILTLFVVGIVALVAFVAAERCTRFPLVDLTLFRSGTFVMSCLSALLFSAAVFGSQPYLSLFMQNYWGFSPLQSGLAFIPATALVAAMMTVSGIMGQRLGSRLRLAIIAGSLAVVVSALYLLRLDAGSTYIDGLLPAFLIRGLGIGIVMTTTSLAVMSAVPIAKSGLASGMLTMARQIGTAMGVAVLGAVFLHHVKTELPKQLSGLPPEYVAQITTAADHFMPIAQGKARMVAAGVVLEGFVRTALAASILCGMATVAACFIRHRLHTGQQAEAPLSSDTRLPGITSAAEPHGRFPSPSKPAAEVVYTQKLTEGMD